MKKLLTTTFLMILAVSCFAYTVTVQNVGSFSSKAGPAGDILIIEDFSGELSGVTMTMTLENTALWYTITDQNLISQSYVDSGGLFPSALGIIGTNRITLSFPVYSGLTPAVVRLSNVWVNSQYLDCESDVTARFMAVVYGIPIERNGITLAHWTPPDEGTSPDIPLDKTYLRYFSCVDQWWSGAAIINDNSVDVSVSIKYTLDNDVSFTVVYNIPANKVKVLPLFSDQNLAGHSGYLKATVPPGCGFTLLLGDGNQMVGL